MLCNPAVLWTCNAESVTACLQIALVLIDEVHLLNESGRGSSLEAGTVCRMKMVSKFPQMAGVSNTGTVSSFCQVQTAYQSYKQHCHTQRGLHLACNAMGMRTPRIAFRTCVLVTVKQGASLYYKFQHICTRLHAPVLWQLCQSDADSHSQCAICGCICNHSQCG